MFGNPYDSTQFFLQYAMWAFCWITHCNSKKNSSYYCSIWARFFCSVKLCDVSTSIGQVVDKASSLLVISIVCVPICAFLFPIMFASLFMSHEAFCFLIVFFVLRFNRSCKDTQPCCVILLFCLVCWPDGNFCLYLVTCEVIWHTLWWSCMIYIIFVLHNFN